MAHLAKLLKHNQHLFPLSELNFNTYITLRTTTKSCFCSYSLLWLLDKQFISMFYNPYSVSVSVCIFMYDKFDKYESIKYRLDCTVPGSNQLIDQEISNHS